MPKNPFQKVRNNFRLQLSRQSRLGLSNFSSSDRFRALSPILSTRDKNYDIRLNSPQPLNQRPLVEIKSSLLDIL